MGGDTLSDKGAQSGRKGVEALRETLPTRQMCPDTSCASLSAELRGGLSMPAEQEASLAVSSETRGGRGRGGAASHIPVKLK